MPERQHPAGEISFPGYILTNVLRRIVIGCVRTWKAKAFLQGQEGSLYDAQEEFRNAEDIEALLLEFVRSHPEDFQLALDETA